MTRRLARILFTAPVAALTAAALGTTAALAATTWTVTPGGAFSGNGSLAPSFGGGGFTCSSSITGKLRHGKGPGGHIGSIAAVGLKNCAGPPPLQVPWTVRAGGLPWVITAQSYRAGTSTGKITGLHLSLSGEACSFTVDGTGGGADNGKVTFTYTNGTHVLKLGTPGNLHTYNVSGCAGLIANGSPASLSASYTIIPPQTITGTMAIGPRLS